MGIPLNLMKSPGQTRPGIWRGGIIQIKVTNYCDLDCRNCSAGVPVSKRVGRLFRMTPRQFRLALLSLKGFKGVIGMFGGNPCLHPQFEELCQIFREVIPDRDQRGLWSNRLWGHGSTCQETFGLHSNLNVHGSKEAWEEMKRDWPEAKPIRFALMNASMHAPIFGSPIELGYTESEMWDRVGRCPVNQSWSAAITVVGGALKAYFCEIAATMAEVTGDASAGVDPVFGWWKRSMQDFEKQVKWACPCCLVPLNLKKVDAASDAREIYTSVWKPLMLTVHGREMQEVAKEHLPKLMGSGDLAIRYLPKGVMPAGKA